MRLVRASLFIFRLVYSSFVWVCSAGAVRCFALAFCCLFLIAGQLGLLPFSVTSAAAAQFTAQLAAPSSLLPLLSLLLALSLL